MVAAERMRGVFHDEPAPGGLADFRRLGGKAAEVHRDDDLGLRGSGQVVPDAVASNRQCVGINVEQVGLPAAVDNGIGGGNEGQRRGHAHVARGNAGRQTADV